MNNLVDNIKQYALALGFSKIGFAKAEFLEEDYNHLQAYIEEGRQGKMAYLERNAEVRATPQLLFADTKSVIAVLANYKTPHQAKGQQDFRIARYAWGEDYHVVLKAKLQLLGRYLQELIPDAKTRVTVDTAPIFEKRWAQRCGLGWIGKNTLLINPELGSFCFIGLILLDKELPYDTAFTADRCGTCERCLHACPTKALEAPCRMNAVKCISYNTIEQKNVTETSETVNFIYGCDICQNACPWNNLKKEYPFMPEFTPNKAIIELAKEELFQLTEDQFNNIFLKSPVKRVGFEKFFFTMTQVVKM